MTTLTEDPLQAIIEHVLGFYAHRQDDSIDPVTRIMEMRRLVLAGACVEGRVPLLENTTRLIPVRRNGVSGEWLLAEKARPDRRLLYIHGGGMIMSDSAAYRHMVETLSRALEAAVFSVDYRLAPEHRWPAAPDDCLAAWRYVLEQGPMEHGTAERLWLAGDSAGGNLALVLLQDLKRSRERLPDAVATLGAATDLSGDARRMSGAERGDPFLTPEGVAALAAVYLPAGQDPKDPRVSPLFGDLTALPPTLLNVGEREVLQDDSRLYAEEARRAGSPVKLVVEPAMFHVFQWWNHLLPEARRSLADIAAFLLAPVD